jgi:putative membrane protein
MHIILLLFILAACNNPKAKDSVEKADSANQANMDSSLDRNNAVVVDEESSAFLVRVANSGMTETQLAAVAMQKAVLPAIRDFAAKLHRDHGALNDTVKNLAGQKNIILPDTMTSENQKEVDALTAKKGKNLDKEFIRLIINNHERIVEMFDKAQLDTKDLDIRAFAGKSLPMLKMHLDSARTLQETYW